jgi:hypothetical protein
MKMMRNIVVALSLILLSAPMISGQDLSKYRTFSLGTSLAELSKQVGPYSLSGWSVPGFAGFVQLLPWRALQNRCDLRSERHRRPD